MTPEHPLFLTDAQTQQYIIHHYYSTFKVSFLHNTTLLYNSGVLLHSWHHFGYSLYLLYPQIKHTLCQAAVALVTVVAFGSSISTFSLCQSVGGRGGAAFSECELVFFYCAMCNMHFDMNNNDNIVST